MEERQLNEKESLELISQMIRNTRTRMERNSGVPFLIWGYTTVFVSLLVWYLFTTTGNPHWNWLWFLIPAVGCPAMLWAFRKREQGVKTYVDRVVSYIWIVFGCTGFLVSCVAIINRMPILFIILLLMGMGTLLTGMVIRSKVVIAAGIFGAVVSLGCLLVKGTDSILVFALAFVFMMVIPGHMVNWASRRKYNGA